MTYKQLVPILRWYKCQIRRRDWDPRISIRSTAWAGKAADGRSYERSMPERDIYPYLSIPRDLWEASYADRTGNAVMAELVAGDHDDWVICAWDGDELTQYPMIVANQLLSVGYEVRRLGWPSTCRLRMLSRGGGNNPYRVYGTITQRMAMIAPEDWTVDDWVIVK